MVDWIRADDTSREWPEGLVVARFADKSCGVNRLAFVWRRLNGDFDWLSDKPCQPTHFFYLPPEPSE